MSTFTSDPGVRIGGRYRLEDRVSASSGWSAWKAIDETLARPVTVLTFAPGFPRINEAITAARSASRLADARLAQVFDVEEDWDHAYVVMEWAGGDSLDDLLADGPLDPGRGAEIIAAAADTLAGAHAAGLSHLCLTPRSLHWTPGGGVKISGLAIDAALSGATSDDPALADVRGLGRLLYAALTAHWPGDSWAGLPPAPEVDGHPRGPRQVRAGVSAALDDITCQALFQRPAPGDSPPLATPALLATALARQVPAPTAPPPVSTPKDFTRPGLRSGSRTSAGSRTGTGYWPPPGDAPWPVPVTGGPGPVAPRRQGPRAMLAAAGVLVLVAAGLGLWAIGHQGSNHTSNLKPPHHHTVAPAAKVLRPVSAHGFDALSTPAQDSANENDSEAPLAIDSNLNTGWHTQFYRGSAKFGGLKSGTGLILDMGRPVNLSSVSITFGSVPGANVRIEVGNDNTRAPATLRTFTTVARQAGVPGGQVTFPAHGSATGRYVLIWFTKLPPQTAGSTGMFEASIYNIVVRGKS